MRKLFTENLGLLIGALVIFSGIALFLPMEISAVEILGLCFALLVIVGGFSWYFHFTSKDVGQAQTPPGPHPPGEGEEGTTENS